MLENFKLENSQEYIDTLIELTTIYGMRVIGAIFILIIGWFIAGRVSKYVERMFSRMKRVDPTLSQFFSSIARYAVLAFTIIAVLNQFGVQTASLIAVLGAAGLAIGLALQGTLSHVASGVLLLIFRPFKVGDFIEVSGHMGTVKRLSLFMTELAMVDNVQILIPNGKVWDQAMKNYSANPTRRMEFILGIGYSDDMDKAIKAVQGVLKKEKRLLDDPAPFVAVNSLGDSSVNLVIRAWAKKEDFWDTKFTIQKQLKEAMDKAGIEIPFPQRTVHLINEK
ncbi:MAG: mechanosensitive ion channel protein MscS [Magnetococcales bacterium]|nr:mechanosensitive ion channel protein MscS [Magnetococcales bacterium]|tara:strand:- start:73475 stop:74314 length:840 start_codon:yes stop_codon:yes gene_type:complete